LKNLTICRVADSEKMMGQFQYKPVCGLDIGSKTLAGFVVFKRFGQETSEVLHKPVSNNSKNFFIQL